MHIANVIKSKFFLSYRNRQRQNAANSPSKLLFTSRPLNIRLLHTQVSFFNWHFVLYSCECCGHVKLTRPSTLSRSHMFESMHFTRREQSYNCVIFR